MKTLVLFYIFLIISSSFAQDFLREMPDEKLRSKITMENFPKEEAVIMLKEQSVNMDQESKVMIVKLLTEAAVKRYGSFEYEYYERYGDRNPCGFEVKARVLKSDNKIEVLDKKEIKKIVSVTRSDGSPMRRKVLFKIPNLAVGDIVQIEYTLDKTYTSSYGGIFFYNDVDHVLVSNVYLTLPSKIDFKVFSFPNDQIRQPEVKQMSNKFGTGKTYFWSVQNLNAIPYEPYSFPFEDQSFMTAYSESFEFTYTDKASDWNSLGKFLYDDVVDKGSVSGGDLDDLNLPRTISKLDFSITDSLYTSLKKNFKLNRHSTIYPVEKLSNLISSKKGDASDLAFLMYKVLEKWKQKENIVLIRDLREGNYEDSVPILEWFDRMGLLVTIDGKEKVYDFDRSISNNYELPWFLNHVNIFVIGDRSGFNKDLSFTAAPEKNSVVEKHNLRITTDLALSDSIELKFCGSNGERLRDKFYDSEAQEVKDYFRTRLLGSCLIKTDTVEINDYLNDREFRATLSGKSSCSAERVDSFLVVRIKNDIFKTLKEKLTTSHRKGHIRFDSPFSYKYLCDIHLPKGYKINNPSGEHEINSTFKSVFKLSVSQKGDVVSVKGDFNVPENTLSQEKYSELMSFIDKAIKTIEKDIVLKKSIEVDVM